ncbi:MAG: hypothetical protein ACYTE8_02705 [Planctomycetota bacterium]|jgi:hypothetical protein
MKPDYSVDLCRELEQKFQAERLYRPFRVARYEPGTELEYEVTTVAENTRAKVTFIIETFIGGGYAGQVYKIRILKVDSDTDSSGGLQVGCVYAMKILVPPSGFAKFFRNLLYCIGFQAAFQPQVNPTAARAGSLWQKFIRRAAKIRFGDENAIRDVCALFVDKKLGSCGEICPWIEGRTWRLEVDDHLDLLKMQQRGKKVDESKLGSPEYRAKKKFMSDFVKLLHEVGAHEFARQYEWSTCKSQPNCLKLYDTEDDPAAGLVAVDFRAGLTLLPFLPMSPGDFKLIFKGLIRGSLVQFDRGNTKKLESFVYSHLEHFHDMLPLLEELEEAETVYRNSIPDITHNHVRLFYSGKLWGTIFSSVITGWKVRNYIDEPAEQKLRACKPSTICFLLIGIIPFLGKIIRRIWGRPDWRKHYFSIFSSFDYFRRAIRGKIAEKLINWHRAGRISAQRAKKLLSNPWMFFCNLPLSILPASWHRFLTDFTFFRSKLHYIFVRPFKLYFSRRFREEWLRNMVNDGKKKHILTDDDADTIVSQLNEPFIQKYLISLAVHICTLPVTQIVSATVALWYKIANNLTWAQAWGQMLLIMAIFQITPISPGSIARGLYTLTMVIRERNFKDYNIAIFLSFFKYIGYLAFPIQMSYHYPALARFMASHWATEATHIVPVFGERGALLEHWVFRLFYNWPLTIRRRMPKIAAVRAKMKPRYWHIVLCAAIPAACLILYQGKYLNDPGNQPGFKEMWWLLILMPALGGFATTLGCKGAVLWKRIVASAICGCTIGTIFTAASIYIILNKGPEINGLMSYWALIIFAFTLLSTITTIITELMLPDPDLKSMLGGKE